MIITALIISIIVVIVGIVGYKMSTGIWPGGRLIVEDSPVSVSGLNTGEAKLMFFYTDWCPFCIQSKEPWGSFKQLMNNSPKQYGGTSILFEQVNCESQESRCALYNIKEYPTFKLQTKEKVYKMLGKPSVESFRAFLKSALGSEST
jgi:thiol-disulfide isomerase/thioredoxin